MPRLALCILLGLGGGGARRLERAPEIVLGRLDRLVHGTTTGQVLECGQPDERRLLVTDRRTDQADHGVETALHAQGLVERFVGVAPQPLHAGADRGWWQRIVLAEGIDVLHRLARISHEPLEPLGKFLGDPLQDRRLELLGRIKVLLHARERFEGLLRRPLGLLHGIRPRLFARLLDLRDDAFLLRPLGGLLHGSGLRGVGPLEFLGLLPDRLARFAQCLGSLGIALGDAVERGSLARLEFIA